MLVLSRKQDQKILFPNVGISVEVVNVKGSCVRLGIEAPRSIEILRAELNGAKGNKSTFNHAVNSDEQRISKPNGRNGHDASDYLNTARLSVYNAKKQIRRDGPEAAEIHLARAIEALDVVSQMLNGNQLESNDAAIKIPLQVYNKHISGSNFNGDIS